MNEGIIDEYGVKCYKTLPKGKKVCRDIFELVTITPKGFPYYIPKYGQKYLLYSEYSNEYQEYIITKNSKAIDLLPFIEKGGLFI